MANSNRNFLSIKCGKKEMRFVNDYSRYLRGFSQNKFGGQQAQRLRTYGGKFGAASPARSLSAEEIKVIEAELKKLGTV